MFFILKLSHVFVNQYYNPDIEMEIRIARQSVFVVYRSHFYFTTAGDFFVFILSGFFIVLAEKFSARTKFEVKRHFTIQAGRIADTQ